MKGSPLALVSATSGVDTALRIPTRRALWLTVSREEPPARVQAIHSPVLLSPGSSPGIRNDRAWTLACPITASSVTWRERSPIARRAGTAPMTRAVVPDDWRAAEREPDGITLARAGSVPAGTVPA